MNLEYVREEVDAIVNNYNGDREMAHIREDNFIIEFLCDLVNSLTDNGNNDFEKFKSDTLAKINLILEMNKKTEDLKWYA
jgi:hypothetical protein